VTRGTLRLTADQLLAATLRQQGLMARRERLDPIDAVERFGPLHATDRATPYLSLLARLDGFSFRDLDQAWLIERRFDRRSAMRGTFHLVTRSRAASVVCAFGTPDAADVRYLRLAGVAPASAKRLRAAVEAALAERSPLGIAALKRALPDRLRVQALEKTRSGGTTLAAVLRWMADAGVLAAAPRRDPRSGAIQPGWEHAQLIYEPYQAAFGPLPACRPADADVELARWYFSAHGPAAFEDWAWWTGFPTKRGRAAFEVIRVDLEEVAAEGMEQPLYVSRERIEEITKARRPAASNGDGPLVRLLPYEDSGIKAYRSTRGRFFDPRHEPEAHTVFGEVLPTILVDGRIAGTWRSQIGVWAGALQASAAKRGTSADTFGRMDRAVRRGVEEELERVAAAVASASADPGTGETR
jgi:hypothetical protein